MDCSRIGPLGKYVPEKTRLMSRMPVTSRIQTSCLLLLVTLLAAGCDPLVAEDHYLRAREYAEDHQTAAAIIELKNALQKDPSHAQARFELGSIYLAVGELPGALKEFERALDLGISGEEIEAGILEAKLGLGRHAEVLGTIGERQPVPPRLLSIKGRAQLQAGQENEGRAVLEEALRQDPTLDRAYVALARLDLGHGHLTGAADRIEQGLRLATPTREIWLAKGDIEEARGDLTAARAAFEQAAQFEAADQTAEVGIVRVMLASNEFDEAREYLDDRLRRHPQDPGFNFYLGALELSQADPEAAQAAFREVQARLPEHLPTLFMMGATQYQLGNYAQAIDQLRRYVSRVEGNVKAYKLLAAAYLKREDPESAIDALAPVEDMLDDAEGHELMGTAYLQLGDFARAMPHLERAAQLGPDSARVGTRLAVGYLGGGDTDAAIRQLEAASNASQDAEPANIMLANVYLQTGRLEEAERVAARFLERAPNNAAAHDLVGVVALARGDRDGANRAFARALEIDPTYAPTVMRQAEMARAEGDVAKAEGLYKQLLEHDPDNLAARLELANLALASGAAEDALEHLERARAAHSSSLEARLRVGHLALRMGKLKTAELAANEALGLAPDAPRALVLSGRVALARGDVPRASERLDRLEVVLGRADPVDPEQLAEMGDLQRRLGRSERARQTLWQAIEAGADSVQTELRFIEAALLSRDAASARRGLDLVAARDMLPVGKMAMLEGDVLALEGQSSEAAAAYRLAIGEGELQAIVPLAGALERSKGIAAAIEFLDGHLDSHPEDALALARLGELQFKTGKTADAIGSFEALTRLEPQDARALNNLAWLYQQAGNERALDVAARAYELAPQNPDVADTYGWILIQNGGDGELATRMLEAAATHEGASATTQYHLAAAYAAEKRWEESETVLRTLLASGDFPERASAKSLLEDVTAASR
jgi:putative PEP-CTERM system TPR-repeat lipoprotein